MSQDIPDGPNLHQGSGPKDSAFTGTIEWVRIDLGDDDHSHQITDEHKMAVAMMRQ